MVSISDSLTNPPLLEERLMDEALKTQAAIWATRIVARYGQAAEPGLSLTEEDHLRDTLATVLRTVMSTKAVADWIKAVNFTLDQWEKAPPPLRPPCAQSCPHKRARECAVA